MGLRLRQKRGMSLMEGVLFVGLGYAKGRKPALLLFNQAIRLLPHARNS